MDEDREGTKQQGESETITNERPARFCKGYFILPPMTDDISSSLPGLWTSHPLVHGRGTSLTQSLTVHPPRAPRNDCHMERQGLGSGCYLYSPLPFSLSLCRFGALVLCGTGCVSPGLILPFGVYRLFQHLSLSQAGSFPCISIYVDPFYHCAKAYGIDRSRYSLGCMTLCWCSRE